MEKVVFILHNLIMMKFLKIFFVLNVYVFSLLFNTLANAKLCNNILIPTTVESEVVSSFFKRLNFLSRRFSKKHLTKKGNVLFEVEVPYVRKQCTGSCVFQSNHTAIEASLKANNQIPKNEFLSGFVSQMKILWNIQNQMNHPGENVLELLSKQQHSSAYWSYSNGKNYTFRANNQKDLDTFVKLDESLIRKYQKDIKKKSVRDYHQQFKKPLDEFIQEMLSFQEEELSKALGRDLSLEENDSFDFKLSVVNIRDSIHYTKKIPQEILETPTKYFFFLEDTVINLSKVFELIVKQIDDGLLVSVATLSKLFNSGHSITLTGYVVNQENQLIGFKYLNSWGKNKHLKGSGCLPIEYFEKNIANLIFIDN